MTCSHCGLERWDAHHDEHVDVCCDCYDLSWGMPLEQLNEERRKAGRPPIQNKWRTGEVG